MRKRRNLIIALLLVVAMVAGIGYAGLAKELTITGKSDLSMENINWAVVFTAAKATSITVNDVETVDPADTLAKADGSGNAATYMVKGLKYAGDSVVFEYTIENQSDAIANLNKVTFAPGSCGAAGDALKFFTTVVEIKTGDAGSYTKVGFDAAGEVSQDVKLQPSNGTATDELHVRITVTLKQTVGVETGDDDDTIKLDGASVKFSFASSVS